ncbi:MAG: hypothetical protein E7Z93_01765 [Cyanobacteria bacterium SIG32]|nr:hypothetical protein [Cyanobacteria bacterium SIG32]
MNESVYITSLLFSEYGYGWPEEVYEYKFKNNKGQIHYSFYAGGISPFIKVKDNEKFSRQIFEIIKDWKHKYYWDYTICDGTLWYLRIRLSNGKYVRYEGHSKFPENYKRLIGYLNRYVGRFRKDFLNLYSY